MSFGDGGFDSQDPLLHFVPFRMTEGNASKYFQCHSEGAERPKNLYDRHRKLYYVLNKGAMKFLWTTSI